MQKTVRCTRSAAKQLDKEVPTSRWAFPPAAEHACAATVVEANPPASNQLQSRSVCNKSQATSRKRMLNLVSEVDTEEQLSKLRKLEIQGKFLEWTDVMHSDLTCRRLIFGMSDGELRFSLQAITNTTPTPDNLRRWGNSEIDSACSLCGQTWTLRHVLNACKVSLLQGRYLWRHNLILGCLQKYLLDFWSRVKKENCAATAPFIRLVPEGTKAINLPSSRQTRRPLVSNDLLRCGNDWVFLFDLETGLIFPPEIASTTQGTDIIIYSKSKKIVVLIELTCPLEDRISTAHELKKDRFLELLSNCRCNGWTAFHFPVEVDRGALLRTLWHLVSKNLVSQSIWPRKPEMNAPRLLYVHPTPFIFSGISGNGLAVKSFALKSKKLLELEKEIVLEVVRGDKHNLRKSANCKAQISSTWGVNDTDLCVATCRFSQAVFATSNNFTHNLLFYLQ